MEGGFSNPPFDRGQECPRSKWRKEVGAQNNPDQFDGGKTP
jgi:hypothetical protein